MTSDHQMLQRSSGSGAIWLLGIASAFILYVLSPGLFVLFHHLGTKPPEWLNYAMLPIAWACQESPLVNRLYEAYMRFLGAPV